MENYNIKESKGYLVVKQDQNSQAQILYADSTACTITGLSIEKLLTANPEQTVKNIKVVPIKLNENHELWTLDTDNQSSNTAQMEERIAELEQKIAVLEEDLKAADEMNKAKSRFLSNMSHDIRTPMNAIMGMTSIALSHIDEKSRVQDCLNKIKTTSAHLMSLINDVLDMSRIDSNRMVLNEEVFSLADLIHDISVIMRSQASQKNQNLQIEIGHIYEETLIGDSLRLRQILVNIIGNAIKYTQSDGTIQVRFTQRLAQTSEKIWLDFQCKDNGIGMSQEFLKRIFIPFERVHNTITSKIEGTGLGMSIVKNLVESMAGQITVESEEGSGSCFYIELPLSIAPSQKNPELPMGKDILIVENRDDLAEQIAAYLRESGLIPIHKKTGLSAVTWLTESQYENHMPCAMLLGQELADMPVLELASHVRQLSGRDFPILLVSEEDWAQLEYRATRAGVSAFVPCPLFKSKLLEVLANLTGNVKTDELSHINREKDYSNYHVLLVEDIELNQEIAVELLSMIGVQVEVADNGMRAVEIFESSPEEHFALIFMDINMPIMDGYEATKRIRQMNRRDAKNVWIVAMTADAFVEDVRQAKDAGMNEHISKPVNPERLQEILFKQLN